MAVPQRQPPQQFQERNTQPSRNNGADSRGIVSVVTMLVSLAALTISMIGAAKTVLDIFDEGLENSMDGIFVKLLVIGLTFLFGWAMGLASIRAFGNLFYPFVIKIYAWACVAAVSLLYIRVILRLYQQGYDGLHFTAYLSMLLGGLFALLCLHLMVEGHDLRPLASPILLVSLIHLFVIVVRYVFVGSDNNWMVICDLTIFLVMIALSALMLAHFGLLTPIRNQIDEMFLKGNLAEVKKE